MAGLLEREYDRRGIKYSPGMGMLGDKNPQSPYYRPGGNVSKDSYRWIDAASDLWEWLMGRKRMRDFGTDRVERLRS